MSPEFVPNLVLYALTTASSVFGYFYARKYKEDREFRKEMYQRTHDLEVNLTRNCTTTQAIKEKVDAHVD